MPDRNLNLNLDAKFGTSTRLELIPASVPAVALEFSSTASSLAYWSWFKGKSLIQIMNGIFICNFARRENARRLGGIPRIVGC